MQRRIEIGEWVRANGDHSDYSFDRQARSSGLVLGRKTYEGLAGHWPSQSGKWADMVNPMPKYVGSRSSSSTCRRLEYPGSMSSRRVPGGVVHKLPADLRRALIASATALDVWRDITPLARNEFICWVEDAKQEKTRERRIRRTQEELEEGRRRPCCWPGCKHRERNGLEKGAPVA